jgi:hypothetical protein
MENIAAHQFSNCYYFGCWRRVSGGTSGGPNHKGMAKRVFGTQLTQQTNLSIKEALINDWKKALVLEE